MKKLYIPTLLNFTKINICLFEATNDVYYLRLNSEFSQYTYFQGSWFALFYLSYNELKKFVNTGGIFKHNRVKFIDGSKVPFLYNSI